VQTLRVVGVDELVQALRAASELAFENAERQSQLDPPDLRGPQRLDQLIDTHDPQGLHGALGPSGRAR